MNHRYLALIALVGMVSCHSNPAAKEPAFIEDTTKADSATVARMALKNLHFDYNKDPACGMPLKAGLEDTTRYNGKLYGFCSKECKAAFLKEPATYLSQIK